MKRMTLFCLAVLVGAAFVTAAQAATTGTATVTGKVPRSVSSLI